MESAGAYLSCHGVQGYCYGNQVSVRAGGRTLMVRLHLHFLFHSSPWTHTHITKNMFLILAAHQQKNKFCCIHTDPRSVFHCWSHKTNILTSTGGSLWCSLPMTDLFPRHRGWWGWWARGRATAPPLWWRRGRGTCWPPCPPRSPERTMGRSLLGSHTQTSPGPWEENTRGRPVSATEKNCSLVLLNMLMISSSTVGFQIIIL